MPTLANSNILKEKPMIQILIYHKRVKLVKVHLRKQNLVVISLAKMTSLEAMTMRTMISYLSLVHL